jgi:hypothetical protein
MLTIELTLLWLNICSITKVPDMLQHEWIKSTQLQTATIQCGWQQTEWEAVRSEDMKETFGKQQDTFWTASQCICTYNNDDLDFVILWI